jgi:hypothetical protein
LSGSTKTGTSANASPPTGEKGVGSGSPDRPGGAF